MSSITRLPRQVQEMTQALDTIENALSGSDFVSQYDSIKAVTDLRTGIDSLVERMGEALKELAK